MHGIDTPSPWVMRFAQLVPHGARVLDFACGAGRHARFFAQAREAYVVAVDRDADALAGLEAVNRVHTRCLDLEDDHWPFGGDEKYDAVVVTNYLWRPRFDDLLNLVKPDGLLIYETFAAGNEAFGKPSRPDFLLQPNELLARLRDRLQIVASEQGQVSAPKSAVVQRIAAVGPARQWPTLLT